MAVLTITTTTPQALRVAEAFGAKLNLGRDATNAEVKADVIQYIRSVVQGHENRIAIAALTDSIFEPT